MKPFQIIAAFTIAIFGFLLILGFLGKTNVALRDISDSNICETSVRINSAARFEGLSFDTDLKCPTLFIELDESRSNNKYVVFKTLALAMSDTWKEFLEGKEEVFNSDTQNYCVIRRVIELKGTTKHEGFFEYLVTNNIPDVKKTYYNYLTNVDVDQGTTTTLRSSDFKKADIIDASKSYAVVYVLAKKDRWAKITSASVGSSTGFIVAGVVGLATGGVGLTLLGAGAATGALTGYFLGSDYASDWQASMLLIPYTQEDLKSLDCTQLPSKLTRIQ